MTVKALKKQLMAAIAMVVVSAIALSSSTYAWFVNNNDVTAEGMSVNASADDSLLIKGTTDEVFSSIGTNALNISAMHPATSFDGLNFGKLGADVQVKSAASSVATWSGDSAAFASGDIVTATNTDNDKYYAETTYKLKSVGTNANVKVSDISISDTNEIFNAIKVSVTIGSTTYVYNPEGTGLNDSGKVGKLADSAWSLADKTYTEIGDDSAFWLLTAGQETDAVVRIWFEGQDEDCFTDQIKTQGTAITIKFSKVQ